MELLGKTGVEVSLDTMVLEVTPERAVHMVSTRGGYQVRHARSIVLAMGCRERTRGAIGIPGTRPAGVFTAGAAQRYVNMEGYMVGRRVVILGSGDIGLIMARRMTLEGAKVLACVEVMPYSGGLNRNIVQCLEDYGIPRGERGGVAGGRAEKAGGWHGDDVRLRHCATERRSDSRERADAASGHRDGCANKRSNRIR